MSGKTTVSILIRFIDEGFSQKHSPLTLRTLVCLLQRSEVGPNTVIATCIQFSFDVLLGDALKERSKNLDPTMGSGVAEDIMVRYFTLKIVDQRP